MGAETRRETEGAEKQMNAAQYIAFENELEKIAGKSKKIEYLRDLIGRGLLGAGDLQRKLGLTRPGTGSYKKKSWLALGAGTAGVAALAAARKKKKADKPKKVRKLMSPTGAPYPKEHLISASLDKEWIKSDEPWGDKRLLKHKAVKAYERKHGVKVIGLGSGPSEGVFKVKLAFSPQTKRKAKQLAKNVAVVGGGAFLGTAAGKILRKALLARLAKGRGKTALVKYLPALMGTGATVGLALQQLRNFRTDELVKRAKVLDDETLMGAGIGGTIGAGLSGLSASPKLFGGLTALGALFGGLRVKRKRKKAQEERMRRRLMGLHGRRRAV
jgi:hypothetical protein